MRPPALLLLPLASAAAAAAAAADAAAAAAAAAWLLARPASACGSGPVAFGPGLRDLSCYAVMCPKGQKMITKKKYSFLK